MRIVVLEYKKEIRIQSKHLDQIKESDMVPLALADGNHAVLVRIDDQDKDLETFLKWDSIENVSEIKGSQKESFLKQFGEYGMVKVAI